MLRAAKQRLRVLGDRRRENSRLRGRVRVQECAVPCVAQTGAYFGHLEQAAGAGRPGPAGWYARARSRHPELAGSGVRPSQAPSSFTDDKRGLQGVGSCRRWPYPSQSDSALHLSICQWPRWVGKSQFAPDEEQSSKFALLVRAVQPTSTAQHVWEGRGTERAPMRSPRAVLGIGSAGRQSHRYVLRSRMMAVALVGPPGPPIPDRASNPRRGLLLSQLSIP